MSPSNYGSTGAGKPTPDSSMKLVQKSYWHPITVIMLMLIIDALGFTTSIAPMTRLFEQLVCRQYYADQGSSRDSRTVLEDPSEDMCKVPAVQDAVAQLFGWQTFFDGIPGLVLAMYYGVLADKNGRRRVLFYSMFGQVLSAAWVLFIGWLEAPLKLTWISSIFLVIGGGSTVTSAVCMMILTDATPESNRSRIFFLAQAVLIVAELIGPALGSTLMQTSLWIPLLLGLLCTTITTALAGTIPETILMNKDVSGGVLERIDLTEDGDSLKKSLRNMYQHTRGTLAFIAQHRSVLFLVATFLVADFSRQSMAILLQYISTRFSIPLSQANYLLSFRAFAQLLTFAVLLPALDIFLTKCLRVLPHVKDLRLARISIILVMTSFAILAMSAKLWLVVVGLVFYTLGSGFNSFARSLVSSLVEPDMIGTLFTTLSIMDTTGSLLAGPIVAGTFSWSMHLGGIWQGMPYIFSFFLCALASVALLQVRAEQPVREEQLGSDEQRAFLDDEERGADRMSRER